MPRGGARRGAGRKKGKTRAQKAATRKRADDAMLAGELPLEYMLRVMRDQTDQTPAGKHRRDEMAKTAAPYCHPKQANIVATHKFDWSKVPLEERLNLERLLSAAAGEGSEFTGPDQPTGVDKG